MADILRPESIKKLIDDLNHRIDEMCRDANLACEREEERSRQWCNDRWRRLDDEARPMRAQRDAMLKAWADAQPLPSIVVSSK